MNLSAALIISEAKLSGSLERVRVYAEDIMNNLIDKYYTDHSIKHLNRIVFLIDLLLSKNDKINLLNENERYILLCATLLHDIGMQDEQSEDDPIKRRHTHHYIASQKIKDDWKDIGLIEEFVEVIALIAEGHRGNIDERFNEKIIGTGISIRCDLLASLLYLCDELDISFERVSISKKNYLNHNAESALHFFKHYYTQGVNISDSRCIEISFRFPTDKLDQYRQIFIPLVVNKIIQITTEITPILQEKYKIYTVLREQDIHLEENNALESIDLDLFEGIVSETMGVKNFLFLNRLNLHNQFGDINPELFFKGNVKWADIVNDLDIRRDQQEDINTTLKELYTDSIKNQNVTGLLISGEGGSGKTTSLLRLAYDTLNDKEFEDVNLLWLPVDRRFNFKELTNLHHSTIKPSIIFIDGINIDSIVETILNQMDKESSKKYPFLFVFAARVAEWDNANGKNVFFNHFKSVQLKTLSDREITTLINQLDKYDQLNKLKDKSDSERFETLKSKCSGQLLVAMLEATEGKRFFKIVLEEYFNIKKIFPDAAKTYALICMFFNYDVLIPEDLLITLVQCSDIQDFELNVLQHTHLLIIKHGNSRYENLYRPRHKEISRILIEHLPEFTIGVNQLKKFISVLRQIDVTVRSQRYVAQLFFNNYVNFIIKFLPKVEYDDRLGEVKNVIYENKNRIFRLIQNVKLIQELIGWSRLFKSLHMTRENIQTLEMIVALYPYDKQINYSLAKELSRTALRQTNPEKVATYFKNSFLGGNRRMLFLFDYLNFCLKEQLFTHLDPIIDGFKDFISYTPEEESLRDKLQALLSGYKIRRDHQALASQFNEIVAHLTATKQLPSDVQLEYIDKIESYNIESQLKKYEAHLLTINPSRPKDVLLRIAHLASKISGQEKRALDIYSELFETYIKNDPNSNDFGILLDYVTFIVNIENQNKGFVYSLFKICKRLNSYELRVYLEHCKFAKQMGDKNIVDEVKREGLDIAIKMHKYESKIARDLKEI